MDNKYYFNVTAKVLDWWKDSDINEYIAIVEINGEWKLVSTKVEEIHGQF